MGRLFGTDGVRGVAGRDLTEKLAYDLGRAAVLVLGRSGSGRPTFLVGRDTRASGPRLESGLVDGISSAGGHVLLAGVIPTPAIAFLTVELGATSGVVISASHNPPEYNGIKFFGPTGYKLPDELEEEIERLLGRDPPGTEPGTVRPLPEARERYLDHLMGAAETRLDGWRLVVDCANGAACGVAPEALRRLGATVHPVFDRPDGENINVGCGAEHPESMAREVRRRGADAGVALDGDADRALFADAEGHIVDGDQVLAALAMERQAQGQLPGGAVVTTVMANLGFHRCMAERGIRVVTAKVGDRYVLEEMLRTGVMLGGEQSGHLIFRDHATTGDGVLTALKFLTLAARNGLSVADLASRMRRYPQVLENVRVSDRDGLADATEVWEAVAVAERALQGRGRVLVRASGTEPLVRVMVEAESEDEATAHARAIAEWVRRVLG